MTTEEKLKDVILKRYHSVREFTIKNDIPYTTIHSIFRRGIGNSSINNVTKICKALGISADALADGEIAPAKSREPQTDADLTDVKYLLEETKDKLHNSRLTLDGKPLGKNGIESIIDAMDVGVEMVKKKNRS